MRHALLILLLALSFVEGLALSFVEGLALPRAPQEAAVEHVVIVSIDALRPEFYLGDWDAPALRAMAREGAHAKAVEGVYPTTTYPSHATIVTGVRPARHGIVANTRFGEQGGLREWHWWARDLKARTLWQAAREKGKKVAIVFWPTTVGAEVDWLVAEVWDPDGRETVKRLAAAATPGLLAELALAVGAPVDTQSGSKSAADEYITAAACHVFRRHRPNLQLVHLLQVDEQQHRDGRDSEAVRKALRAQDANVAKIRKAIEESGVKEKTLLIVTGDHGFADVSRQANPNTLLVAAGLIELEETRLKSWKALVHAQTGSAAVYVKDPGDAARVAEVLRRGEEFDGAKLYAVVPRARLDELGYNPAAAMALEAADGVAISGSLTGGLVGAAPVSKGGHGHLPARPGLQTGFIAAGAGVRPGASVERMRLVDIAPTVAKLMGLAMKDVEGAPVEALLR